MICEVFKCVSNENGYCPLNNYIKIEEDGTCSKMCVLTEDENENEEHKMNNDKHNASGCLDLTAYEAINNIEKEEKDQKELVRTILYICRKAGFKVEGRIVLTAVKSGRTYK